MSLDPDLDKLLQQKVDAVGLDGRLRAIEWVLSIIVAARILNDPDPGNAAVAVRKDYGKKAAELLEEARSAGFAEGLVLAAQAEALMKLVDQGINTAAIYHHEPLGAAN